MKRIIFSLILFINISSLAQEEPFYEQIAFDFYSTKIIDSFPVKKKIKVYKYLNEFQLDYVFNNPTCLGVIWRNNKQFKKISAYEKKQNIFDSKFSELDFSKLNKKKFKVKRNDKGNFPKLYFSSPNLKKGVYDYIYLNIHEKHSDRLLIIYHLKFNKKGEVISWCREISETIIIH